MTYDETKNANRHIHDYLDYYISLSSPPHYAVMLSGPWGIGKTFLVKRYLANKFPGTERKPVYVSLYGLGTLHDIDNALFQSIYPVLDSKITKVGGKILEAAARRFGINPQIKLSQVISKFNADLYVFDDLERFQGSISAALGYINDFVEHGDCKVLVIAHEVEIDEPRYRDRREKIIGKTLEVQSSLSEALAHFLSQVKDASAKNLMDSKTGLISNIYNQSALNNLRILQQTIWDFERLVSALETKHLDNEDAMTQLLSVFFPLSFELKAGRLNKDDLAYRMDPLLAEVAQQREEAENDPFLQAASRYAEIDLSNTILSDHLLQEILDKGIVDPIEIRSCLDKSPFFAPPGSEPAWYVLWDLFNRTDDEVETALAAMEKQFVDREIETVGEILHIFGVRLTLSEYELIQKTAAEVAKESKAYIDDLLSEERLTPLAPNASDFELSHGFGGLGFQSIGTPQFSELVGYTRKKRVEAYEAQYPILAEELLTEMQEDPDLYFRRITLTNSHDNIYYQVPILAAIDIDRYLSILIDLTPRAQHTVLSAFKSRYEHGDLSGRLSPELPWLQELHKKLNSAIGSLRPTSKTRLSRYVQNYVEPFLPL